MASNKKLSDAAQVITDAELKALTALASAITTFNDSIKSATDGLDYPATFASSATRLAGQLANGVSWPQQEVTNLIATMSAPAAPAPTAPNA